MARAPVERRQDAGVENFRFGLQPIAQSRTGRAPALLIELVGAEANLPLDQVQHEPLRLLRIRFLMHGCPSELIPRKFYASGVNEA